MQKQAIFLMGPTAAGKTALAIEIAQHLPVDIISVDSAMVYRGMDIGTGKPSVAELKIAPHQLIDICDPKHAYSAAQFCAAANIAMQHSWQQDRIPLLVGGTMLYFKALQYGLARLPCAAPQLRLQLTQQAQQIGWPAMHAQLATLDPATAQRLSVNDSQRIQRALEINLLTGQQLNTIFAQQDQHSLNYKLSSFSIMPASRDHLHHTIEQRFMDMLGRGLIAEVAGLYQRGDLDAELPAIRSVGYKEVWQYLNGSVDFITMCEQAIAATRQLAKRQLTWLRGWPDVIHINNSDGIALDTVIKSVLDSRKY